MRRQNNTLHKHAHTRVKLEARNFLILSHREAETYHFVISLVHCHTLRVSCAGYYCWVLVCSLP